MSLPRFRKISATNKHEISQNFSFPFRVISWLKNCMKNEDFYIGYLPKMPKSLAKVVKTFVIVSFVAAISLVIISWLGQKPFAKSVFEFGTLGDFAGTIQAKPIPFLLIEKQKKNNGLPIFERIPLVAEGKHGFDAKSLDGQKVKLRGTLIYRDDLRMIEVIGDSVERASQTIKPIEEKSESSLGSFSLKGEIVDSKCYLGVMNPGNSKPHRECAVACLRGGIPPLFIVKDTGGNVSELWLLSEKGEPVNKEILDFVAEPIEISGEVSRTGDQLFFKINPNQIKRLP